MDNFSFFECLFEQVIDVVDLVAINQGKPLEGGEDFKTVPFEFYPADAVEFGKGTLDALVDFLVIALSGFHLFRFG